MTGSGLSSPGAVAQLGERGVRNAEVEGSTPFRSTRKPLFHNDLGIRILNPDFNFLL